MAVNAAIEGARCCQGRQFRIVEKPLTLNASNSSVHGSVYSGYGRYNYSMAQNLCRMSAAARDTGLRCHRQDQRECVCNEGLSRFREWGGQSSIAGEREGTNCLARTSVPQCLRGGFALQT